MEFEYCQRPDLGDQNFMIMVPAGICSKPVLLDELARAGRFPHYFGRNWDALLDCLLDLSWIDQRSVAVVHEDVPLIGQPSECRIYLEILKEALCEWFAPEKLGAIELPAGWRYRDHHLRVIFPAEARAVVEALSTPYK